MVNTDSRNTDIRTEIMINFISLYLGQWFDFGSKHHEYGTELENYILSNNPQSIYEVEQLTKQFEQTLSKGK
jgi:hypothetical protein